MTQTFAPTRNPSFDYELDLAERMEITQFGKGYASTRPLGLRPLRRATLRWNVLTKDERDYIEDFFYHVRNEAFYWVPLDEEFSPLAIDPVLTETASGSLGSRTYYVTYTWYNSTDTEETIESSEVSMAMSANNVLVVTLPVFPTSADNARIYAATSAGAGTLQTTTTERTWQEPDSGLVAGANPPTANNLKVSLIWRAESMPRFVKYQVNRYRCELRMLEQVVT